MKHVDPFDEPLDERSLFNVDDPLASELELADVAECRVCGCSEFEPCEGGCIWVEEDLCSRCLS